jgi:HK97 family phage major capsid protein
MSVELTHSQAVNRLKDIDDEVERLQAKGEKGPLTPEDEAAFAELTREFDEVNEHRKALERTAERERLKAARVELTVVGREQQRDSASGNAARGYAERVGEFDRDAFLEPDSIESARFRNPWDLSEVRSFGRSDEELADEMRARALSAIEKMPASNDRVRESATGLLERFDDKRSSLARQVLITSSPEYLRAWVKAVTGQERTMSDQDRAVLARAMSLTDAEGGYLVPFQLDPTVIITSSGTANGVRALARQVVATGDVWHGVSSTEATWSWDAEGQQASDDAPTVGQPEIPNYKGAGFIPASFESLNDMSNATTEIAGILAAGKATLEATAFATGTGSGQPTGIVTALVASSPTVIVASAATDTFAIADVYSVSDALPERHQERAAWLAHRKTYSLVRQFDTSGGAGLWETLGNGQPSRLIGQRVATAEAMDGVVTASAENYMMVYGDFNNYVITDRIGFSVEFIPHLMGSNGRPTGSRGFYAWYRTGADSVNDDAFRLLNVT